MIQLVAFVLSRIDYCNAVLAGLPWTECCSSSRLRPPDPVITLLQRWPNYTGCRFGFALNWNCACFMHHIRVGRCPSYLAALVSSSADNCRRPGLCSASSSSGYLKRGLRTKLGERVFFLLRSSGVELSPW